MEVLSLFDGISCGQLALNRSNIPYEKYYASEIDKYAIQVTQKNYPNTVQLGDVKNIHGKDFKNIGLLLGGSPCQGFSFAGKQLNFQDERSKLFFEYVRLLKETHPKYFLFENVVMKQEYQNVITEHLGVQPIKIESALVAAANRKRLYWTNIPVTGLPEDRHIMFGDIREYDVPLKYYYTEKGLAWIHRSEIRRNKKLHIVQNNEKMQMLEASMHKKYSNQRFFGIEDVHGLRYITPTECERCMTVPDGYTACVSDTQRYIQLGNGWNVDTIAWILSFLPSVHKNSPLAQS